MQDEILLLERLYRQFNAREIDNLLAELDDLRCIDAGAPAATRARSPD